MLVVECAELFKGQVQIAHDDELMGFDAVAEGQVRDDLVEAVEVSGKIDWVFVRAKVEAYD